MKNLQLVVELQAAAHSAIVPNVPRLVSAELHSTLVLTILKRALLAAFVQRPHTRRGTQAVRRQYHNISAPTDFVHACVRACEDACERIGVPIRAIGTGNMAPLEHDTFGLPTSQSSHRLLLLVV